MSAEFSLNAKSLRARRARMASRLGKKSWKILIFLSALLGAAALASWLQDYSDRTYFACLALGCLLLTLALWYKRDLSVLPPKSPANSLDDILEPSLLAALTKKQSITPQLAWQTATSLWQGRFVLNRLILDHTAIQPLLTAETSAMGPVWQAAFQLMSESKTQQLDAGTLTSALLISQAPTKDYLAKANLKENDVAEVHDWLQRLNRHLHMPKPYFGGIGRDWAAGFTPMLDRVGNNISRQIEMGVGHFHTLAHADTLDSVVHNLSRGSGVALVGETGTGKTSLVYALAERLLSGRDQELLYYQIFSLDAPDILSTSPENLERAMLTLFGEANRAGNIIIFLDDAQLFLKSGTGSFDAGQILLSVLQSRGVKIIAALTPHELQHLKSSNSALASLLAQVSVNEPPPEVTADILEDTGLTLESKEGVIVTYPALKEAYRLSGQFEQEIAYPGKAISLLQQSVPYASSKILTNESVQQAVEKTRGVKVSKAEAPEADKLLHLEDHIHQRMINQERAVKVVAGALRRGRAGVANPNRPVGSFLFLGPTGVGKTELARSLASTYFGDEKQMIRLDMSEYQHEDDVSRLLDPGTDSTNSLIMSIRQQPFSVVLLDELEKAHPNILNLLLQTLDEGQLTDSNDRAASFKNAIIIATSNAGSAEITAKVAAGDGLESFERPLIDKLISGGQFKAELINRFDEVVLFRPLNQQELTQVARLMLASVNKTLANQNVSVQLTDAALAKVVQTGYDPQFGARPMRRAIQKMVEDAVAQKVLSGAAQPGSVITLDENDLAQV